MNLQAIKTPARWLAAICIALGHLGAQAQSFPNKPITIVSPYQAGGVGDNSIRAIAEGASRELNTPVIVEPKPGAEGMIGALDVLRAQPDGYRLLWGGAGPLMIVPALRKSPPFDPVTAFTPLAAAVDFSFYLYVHPGVPARTMREFVEYVRAHPGKVNYGTGNNQGLLSTSRLIKDENLDMVHVAYKGEGAAVTDLLAGRIQAMFATSSPLPFATEGKLRVLVTTLSRRSPLLPETPTMKEAGLKELDFGGGWLGIYGPAGLQRPVADRLAVAFSAALSKPDVQAKLQQLGLVYTPVANANLSKFNLDQRDMYRKAVVELGVPTE